MNEITLLIRAGDIPDGTWVSKVTGEKKYKLCTSGIKLYHKNGAPVQVVGDDLILLTNPTSTARMNVVRPDTMLKVQLSFEEARDIINYLEEAEEETDTQ